MNIENILRSITTSPCSVLYWNRKPGTFVNKETGVVVDLSNSLSPGEPAFSGGVRFWYETLVETIFDASNRIKEKENVDCNSIFVSPDVCTMLECSVFFKPKTSDTEHYGTISDRFNVYRIKNLKRNTILVCNKTNENLEQKFAKVTVLDLNTMDDNDTIVI